MLETKPDDLTLAVQKATEGFTAVIDRPTDNAIINIGQLILPVLMTMKYDELTLTHNLSGFFSQPNVTSKYTRTGPT